MSNILKSLNDTAWEQLFEQLHILKGIEDKGEFVISARQIKKVREPRLMVKFDHSINRPKIFEENNLSILPITRGDYLISQFDAYHKFELNNIDPKVVSLPGYIQSLNTSNISSETIALNCAVVTGIIADFLDDDEIAPTVSGRMGTGEFDFNIRNLKSDVRHKVHVCNSQIEIDAAYEGIKSLALFEAKRDLSEDFLIRQLYYPFRVWTAQISKPVRPVFLVYSNGVYHIHEYEFTDPSDYNSIKLINRKNYIMEDTVITSEDVQGILNKVRIETEPSDVPFPQADTFDRVVNICELLGDHNMSRNEVTEKYAFDARQTNYYTDAARYLGLLEKHSNGNGPQYKLSDLGSKILKMGYKQRQIAFCKSILSHKVFHLALKEYFKTGEMPETVKIVQIMKSSKLHNIDSDTTYERRSSTVKGWLKWIVERINE